MNIDNLSGALQENPETIMIFSQIPQDGAVEPRAEFNISGPERLIKQLAKYFDCTDVKQPTLREYVHSLLPEDYPIDLGTEEHKGE